MKNVNYSPIPKNDVEELVRKFRDLSDDYSYEKGIKEFEKYLLKKKNVYDEKIFSLLGLMYDHLALQKNKQRKKLEQKAFRIYRKMLKINPKSYRALWGIGRIFWHRKDKKALSFALAAYKQKKKIEGRTGLYGQHIGLVYSSLGDKKNAEKWLLRGAKENPKEWGSFLNLVNFYNDNNNYIKAKKYAKILKFNLLKNEEQSFFKTEWGKKVLKIASETIKK